MNKKLEEFSFENCIHRQPRQNALDGESVCFLAANKDQCVDECPCLFAGADYRECPVYKELNEAFVKSVITTAKADKENIGSNYYGSYMGCSAGAIG